jgi:hypothetical protein
MLRRFGLLAALAVTVAPLAHAAAADAPPPAVAAKFQQAALKTCNDDLDHDHFDRFTSIDDCVEYKTAKMNEAYRRDPTGTAAAAEAQISNSK